MILFVNLLVIFIVWIFIMALTEDKSDRSLTEEETSEIEKTSDNVEQIIDLESEEIKINEIEDLSKEYEKREKDSKDNTNKVFELVYKTDYFFDALEKDITTGEIRKKSLAEYLLVYNSTGKVSDKYSNYKLAYCKDITNGKRSSRVIDVYKDILENSDIHYNEQITKCIIEDKIVPNSIKYYFENLYNCSEIIDLHNIDTSNIKDMSYMFSNCKNITKLDLSNFNTKNVTDMSCMFMCCENLELLNLRNFDTRKVKNFSGIFQLCLQLSTIYVGDKWIVNDEMNSEIFAFCKAQQVTYLGEKQNIDNKTIVENKIFKSITSNKESVDTDIIFKNNICILEIDSSTYGKSSMVTEIIDRMNTCTRVGHNEYGYFLLFTIDTNSISTIVNKIREKNDYWDFAKTGVDIVCYIPKVTEQVNLEIGKTFIDKPIENRTKELLELLDKYSLIIDLERSIHKRGHGSGFFGGNRVGVDYDYETYIYNSKHSK